MKYRDPETGEFKELYVKAADTLPVGTEVDYDGTEVPAGWEAIDDVVESGSNANGDWIKWSNGWMICVKKMTTSVNIQDAYGSFYQGSVDLGQFPQPFDGAPIYLNVNNNGVPFAIPEYINSSTHWGNARVLYVTKLTDYAVNIRAIAIGKWK